MGFKTELAIGIGKVLLTRQETPTEAFHRAMRDPDLRDSYRSSIDAGLIDLEDLPDRRVFVPRRVLRRPGNIFDRLEITLYPGIEEVRKRSFHHE